MVIFFFKWYQELVNSIAVVVTILCKKQQILFDCNYLSITVSILFCIHILHHDIELNVIYLCTTSTTANIFSISFKDIKVS